MYNVRCATPASVLQSITAMIRIDTLYKGDFLRHAIPFTSAFEFTYLLFSRLLELSLTLPERERERDDNCVRETITVKPSLPDVLNYPRSSTCTGRIGEGVLHASPVETSASSPPRVIRTGICTLVLQYVVQERVQSSKTTKHDTHFSQLLLKVRTHYFKSK
jgi:hypothetical protein